MYVFGGRKIELVLIGLIWDRVYVTSGSINHLYIIL